MNLYNLFPKLNGYKTVIGTYGMMILGFGAFLVGLGQFIIAIGNCVMALDLTVCQQGISEAWMPLVVAFGGLTGLGIGHKIEKSKTSDSL